MADTLLGLAYMEAPDFRDRAISFGCGGPVIASFGDAELDAVLASASRAIEGYTNRSFTVNSQIETQYVDLFTRRIRVDKPPVMAIASATLQVYPTPRVLDITQWLINNAENYIEIPGGQLGFSSGNGSGANYVNVAEYPAITITYTSGQALPPVAVVNAVGFVAAELLNRNYASRLIPAGLTEVTRGKQTVQRAPFDPTVRSIPEIARQILANDVAVSPRMVPRGYPSRYLKGGPQYRVP